MEIIAQSTLEKQDTPTVWYGCYDTGWGNDITSLSYSHPAKMSRGLAVKIYQYALERGWLKSGMVVVDPFAGIGGTCLDALANGLSWIGCELERRFTDLGQGCDCTGISKADWVRFYGRLEKANYKDGRHWCPQCLAQARKINPPLPKSFTLSLFEDEPEPSAAYVRNSGIIPETKPHRYKGNLDLFRKYAKPGTFAVLLNGDSRYLRSVIGQAVADGLLSSPPYANGEKGHPSLGSVNKDNWGRDGRNIAGRRGLDGNYGGTNGQLANLKEGDLDGLLSSPPYATDTVNSRNGIDKSKFKRAYGSNSQALTMNGYGDSEGQLNSMPTGDLDGLLSSPPYVNQPTKTNPVKEDSWSDGKARPVGASQRNSDGYGDNPDNLGNLPPGDLDGLLSSPPYTESQTGGTDIYNKLEITHKRKLTDRSRTAGYRADLQGDSPGQLAALPTGDLDGVISSPPFSPPGNNPTGQGQGVRSDYRNGKRKADSPSTTYGATSGQLGSMPMVDLDGLLASPPFAGNTGGRGEASRNGIDAALFDRHSGGMKRGTGDNPGNLDHLPMRGFEDSLGGIVTSPPYEGSLYEFDQNRTDGLAKAAKRPWMDGMSKNSPYGQTTGQLGIETGQTFWEAARAIVSESYLVLKPGSYSFWVCKKFVRNGCIVDFPDQWKRLCEAVGFEYVETIRAMLVSQENEQKDLNGGGKVLRKERKSFFRRLAEKNGSPRIDYEEVVILRKPEARQ